MSMLTIILYPKVYTVKLYRKVYRVDSIRSYSVDFERKYLYKDSCPFNAQILVSKVSNVLLLISVDTALSITCA